MAGKNKQPRGKGRKQSLASRKREKNMSGALLENAYHVDTKDVVPFKASWDTQVPRKMRQMMHAPIQRLAVVMG